MDNKKPAFKSGFISIIGLPNAGKSTLLNALIGNDLAVINPKAQTTRHRILGILTKDSYQIVFSDTPGLIKDPKYLLHEKMNKMVQSTFSDADGYILVQDVTREDRVEDEIVTRLGQSELPIYIILNKADIATEAQIDAFKAYYSKEMPKAQIIITAASLELNTDLLRNAIVDKLPEGPQYYPDDQLSDRNDRFFVSEIIREKILSIYSEEVPYSVQVVIENYEDTKTKKGDPIARIYAIIYVMRETQKGIILGAGGRSIKHLGTIARKEIEDFIDKKVFLEMTVKVRKNWRDDDKLLEYFGYES